MSEASTPKTRVFLHVGPPKTGTTYLQEILRHWHRELLDEGILIPAAPTLDHFNAALDLRGDRSFGIGEGSDLERPRARGAWGRLVGVTSAHRGTVVISHELFASVGPAQAAKAIVDLAPSDVHVVITARDPGRQIVSSWQERIKHGGTRRFRSVARRVERGESPLGTSQDLIGVLDVWGTQLPAGHVHVVTVPPAGSPPEMLWQRFAGAIGVNPSVIDPSVVTSANESLGMAEIELLRRVNRALRGRVPHPAYSKIVTKAYANRILAGGRTSPTPALPKPLWGVADKIAEEWIGYIVDAGYDVVGDLDDLRPGGRAGARTRAPSERDVSDASVRATAELLVLMSRMTRPGHAVRQALHTTGRTAGYAALSWGQRVRYGWRRRRSP